MELPITSSCQCCTKSLKSSIALDFLGSEIIIPLKMPTAREREWRYSGYRGYSPNPAPHRQIRRNRSSVAAGYSGYRGDSPGKAVFWDEDLDYPAPLRDFRSRRRFPNSLQTQRCPSRDSHNVFYEDSWRPTHPLGCRNNGGWSFRSRRRSQPQFAGKGGHLRRSNSPVRWQNWNPDFSIHRRSHALARWEERSKCRNDGRAAALGGNTLEGFPGLKLAECSSQNDGFFIESKFFSFAIADGSLHIEESKRGIVSRV